MFAEISEEEVRMQISWMNDGRNPGKNRGKHRGKDRWIKQWGNKGRNFLAIGLAAILLLTGCAGGKPASTAAPTADSPAKPPQTAENLSPVHVQNGEHTLTFTQVPERAVTLNQHVTEIMLALGLADRMAGMAYLDDRILPQFQQAYEKIPVLSDQYPSKEVLLAAEPDFVYAGWKSAFTEKGVGTVQELASVGIQAYLHQSSNMSAPDLEDVAADIRNIGRIFRIEDRADRLIGQMKAEMDETVRRIGEVKQPLRVFVYDSGEDQPLTAGSNFMSRMIAMAGGQNIFDDIPKGWTSVSWEEVVSRQPEVIVVVDYGDRGVEQKKQYLLAKKELADLPAIQNNRLIVLPLSAAAEGIRAPHALQTLAEGFYPEKFAQGP